MKRFTRLYVLSVAWILTATAAAKLYSALGAARILDLPEALLPMSNRQAFWLLGLVELGIVLTLVLGRNTTVKLIAIAWLGGNFLLYRLGAMLLTVGRPCPCLGSLTEKLPLKPLTVDRILSAVVFYLVFGSTLFLLLLSRKSPAGGLSRGSEAASGAGHRAGAEPA